MCVIKKIKRVEHQISGNIADGGLDKNWTIRDTIL